MLIEKERRVGRVPGIAIYHTETLRGLPASFCHLVAKLPAVHQTVVFLTVRQASHSSQVGPILTDAAYFLAAVVQNIQGFGGGVAQPVVASNANLILATLFLT